MDFHCSSTNFYFSSKNNKNKIGGNPAVSTGCILSINQLEQHKNSVGGVRGEKNGRLCTWTQKKRNPCTSADDVVFSEKKSIDKECTVGESTGHASENRQKTK